MSEGRFDVGQLASCALAIWYGACMAIISVVDARERRIPNGSVAAVAMGAAVQVALCRGAGIPALAHLPAPGERFVACGLALVGGYLLERAWRASHDGSHGMGYGDIKLIAAMALWFGTHVLGILLVATLVAVAVALGRGRRSFPFGPYLGAASVACLLIGLFGAPSA